jgi:renalase
MSGLAAGRILQAAGWRVTVLDKGRVAGGRMATRSFDDGRFDYGAQFVTLRDAAFAELAAPWVSSGLLVPWTEHRYWVKGGMRSVPETMAAGLNVRVGARVARVVQVDGGWAAELESGDPLRAERVLLTAPVPQSLELLEQGGVVLHAGDAALLAEARYWKSLTVLARIEGAIRLGPEGYAQPSDGVLAWVADNSAKGVSAEPGCLTLHGEHAFSERNWNEVPAGVVRTMLDAAAPYFNGRVRSYYLHRWRYAEPSMQMPALFHGIGRLAFAGDVFGGPRVGGAVASGMAAAAYLLGG